MTGSEGTPNTQDGPDAGPAVAEWVAAEIPNVGDSTTYAGFRITHWGRMPAALEETDRG